MVPFPAERPELFFVWASRHRKDNKGRASHRREYRDDVEVVGAEEFLRTLQGILKGG